MVYTSILSMPRSHDPTIPRWHIICTIQYIFLYLSVRFRLYCVVLHYFIIVLYCIVLSCPRQWHSPLFVTSIADIPCPASFIFFLPHNSPESHGAATNTSSPYCLQCRRHRGRSLLLAYPCAGHAHDPTVPLCGGI